MSRGVLDVSVSGRNRRIDLLRGISIGLVLLHHFNIAYSLNDTLLSRLFGWDVVKAVMRNGNYGVTMFFVISGFLITSNAERRWGNLGDLKAWAFYRFRAARILPCLLLLLLSVNVLAACGLTIFQNHPENGPPVSFWIVDLASLTFWMNVLMARAGWLNYVLCVQWSLSVEEVFYLAFPILCLILKRESRLIAVWLLFVIIGPIWRATHQDDESGFLFAYLACFDAIAIGCCTALMSKYFTIRLVWAPAMQSVVAVAMAALYVARPIGETNVYGVTLMALGAAGLIMTAPKQPPDFTRASNGLLRVVHSCGKLSYELYLFHLLVLGGLQAIWPPDTIGGNRKLLLLIAYLALSVGVAQVVGRLYSEPLNRILRGRFGRPSLNADA